MGLWSDSKSGPRPLRVPTMLTGRGLYAYRTNKANLPPVLSEEIAHPTVHHHLSQLSVDSIEWAD